MSYSPRGRPHEPEHEQRYDDAFDTTPYDSQYSPYYGAPSHQPETRPPPPSGPAPAYMRVISKANSHTLRPILLLCCFVSLCFLILLGAQDFRMAGTAEISSRYKTFELVQGILFMAAAGVELFGLFSTYTQRLALAKTYTYLSLGALAAVITSEILGVIVIFTLKEEVVDSCVMHYSGSRGGSGGYFWGDSDDVQGMTPNESREYCETLWGRNRTWDIIWLIVTAIVGTIFVLFGFAYARQLADPSSTAMRRPRNPFQNNWSTHQYDPEDSHFRYPPGPNNPYAYPPPPGPPPDAQDSLPVYKRRPSMEDYDGDAKSLGYSDEEHHAYNRPGSSRSVRRDSGETLRGESTAAKDQDAPSQTPHSQAQHQDNDDDDTPRV